MFATRNQEFINFRKSLGLNQTQLGERLNCPQSLIAAIETGKRKIPQSLKEILKNEFNFIPQELSPKDITSNIIPIKIYQISASAGSGLSLAEEEPEQDFLYFDKRFLQHILRTSSFENLHIIYAKGDSMDSGWNQPDDIKDGDMLMIDTTQTSGNGNTFVILVNNQELRVKKLVKRGATLFIYSNNSKYQEEVYTPDSSDVEIKVIGKVIWNGRKDSV